jgi:hypothetical protein
LNFDNKDTILQVINSLEGLEVLFLQNHEPRSFVLPPSWFHCVLTLTASAHCGIPIIFLDHANDSKELIDWELTCMDDPDMINEEDWLENTTSRLTQLEKLIKEWEKLIGSKNVKRDEKQKISGWIKGWRKSIKKIKAEHSGQAIS